MVVFSKKLNSVSGEAAQHGRPLQTPLVSLIKFVVYGKVEYLSSKCQIYYGAHIFFFYINMCAIEYSLGDAPTALKHGDEACLHIWHLS